MDISTPLCMLVARFCHLGLSGDLWYPITVGEDWLETIVVWGEMELLLEKLAQEDFMVYFVR